MKFLMISIALVGATATASAFAQTNPSNLQGSATQTTMSASQQIPSYSQPVEGKTRAQVYQELVQAEKDGSLAAMDKTYAGG